jgi:hypothetical protein
VSDDAALREVYAAVSRGSPPHLEEGVWVRLACGELSAEERERALDHASRCAECGRILRALALLDREARAVDPAAPAALSARRAAPRARGRWVWAGLAAAAAVVVGVLARPTAAPPTAVEEVGVRSAAEGDRPVPTRPLDEQAAAPEAFSWEGLAGARGYRVELLDEAGEMLWRSEPVSGTTLRWPESVAPAPGRYYWRVVATLEERGETRASPLVSFEIRQAATR